MATTNQITTKPSGGAIRDWLSSDTLKAQISQALPAICKPERFMRVLVTAMQKTPKLLRCSQASLFQALMNCASLGIEPDGRRAHLIPYGDACQLIIDYKGLLELVKRSGDVISVRAEKVCENDNFQWVDGAIKHAIDFKRARGNAYAYYAEAKLKDGSIQNQVMTKDEVDSIRKRSRASSSGPWVTDYDEMAKKTVFRRLTKWLVLSPEVQEAIDTMDKAEFETDSQKGSVPVSDVLDAAIAVDASVEDVPAEQPPEEKKTTPSRAKHKPAPDELAVNDELTPKEPLHD